MNFQKTTITNNPPTQNTRTSFKIFTLINKLFGYIFAYLYSIRVIVAFHSKKTFCMI